MMMVYKLNPIPSHLPPHRVREVERLRSDFKSGAIVDQGVLRWKSNGRVVPLHCFRDAFCEPPFSQQATYDRETSEILAEYRARMANHVPDAEEMFEMRAAFGRGTTVVNVITGKRTRL